MPLEDGKRPYQKVILAIAFGVAALVINILFLFLFR